MKKIIILVLFLFIVTIIFNNYKYPNDIKKLQTITLYDSNNIEYYSVTKGYERTYISNIPEHIKKAFVLIEDKNFYSHHGFDILRIARVFFTNFFSKKEGASTITQQLARMLFLNNEKTYQRKFKELIIALRLENKYSKDEILECYLNNLYFGHNIYGIYDASYFFFNKSIYEINNNELAMLIAIIKGPSIYSPINNYLKANERKKIILKKIAKNEPSYDISIYGKKTNKYNSSILFYKDIVLKYIDKNKSLDIYTNYDSNLGNEALKYENSLICAVEPFSGKVKLVYSGNYYKSNYNKVMSSNRQIGSTIKPFLYYSALNCGMNPLSKFKSEKTSFKIKDTIYSPKNFNDKYENDYITMAYALATSDNIYAVKTHLYIGTDKLVNTLSLLGIKSDKNPSLALGCVDTTLYKLCNAYNILASLGNEYRLYFINEIKENGKTIYTHKIQKNKKLNYEETFVINHLLTYTFNKNISHKINVTGSSISPLLNYTYAGKSGSTDKDSYMIGFNKNITIGVSTTYNDTINAKLIWANIIESYNKSEAWYYDDNIKKIYANPTGFNNYMCNIYINEYLPKYKS